MSATAHTAGYATGHATDMGGTALTQPDFLPMSRAEMQAIGWHELDVLLVSGDAYVDHPAFAVALLGRFLVEHGYRVGVVSQPPWQNQPEALARLRAMGRPRLFAGVSAGAIDSLLAHYTAFRKKRSDDAYTPGGTAGARPNRAVLVYSTLLRQAFSDLPLVIGGIEASLRRVSHYDFWSDSLRRSILLDSKADLLIYGMGEQAILDSARAAEQALGQPPHEPDRPGGPGKKAVTASTGGAGGSATPRREAFSALTRQLPGCASVMPAAQATALLAESGTGHDAPILLPSHEALCENPALLIQATLELERQVHQRRQSAIQFTGAGASARAVLVTPPAPPTGTEFLDALYALPFSRLAHPSYTAPVPAWEMIRTSITSHRGCGGGCAFCTLALHQGRAISSRSRDSLLREAAHIAQGPDVNGRKASGSDGRTAPGWAGSISDVGGPSANMWQGTCTLSAERCTRSSCLHPRICPGFRVPQTQHIALLRDMLRQKGVRHVRIASGVRFDLALQDDEALAAYTGEFTGGQLKVAPEHCADPVLRLMRKPPIAVLEDFLQRFSRLSGAAGKEQYTVPYLMSAYPGCTEAHMRELGAWLRQRNWQPQQVQCFIPTPGSLATAMFYAGADTQGNPIYVARSDAERLRQHHMLFAGGPARDDEKRPGNRRSQSAATGKAHGAATGKAHGKRSARTRRETRH